MDNAEVTESTLTNAFQVVYALLAEASQITAIVLESLATMETMQFKQQKRQYDKPAVPKKAIFDDIELFQYSIYSVVERFEIAQEEEYLKGRLVLREEILVIRYLKCLIFNSIDLRSFHVAIGISRLLYSYGSVEALAFYQLVSQWTDEHKNDGDCREHLAKLYTPLKARFNNFLELCQGSRRELRFHNQPRSVQLSNLVDGALPLFTPWQSTCVLPASFSRQNQEIAELDTVKNRFSGQAAELVEKARKHTLIHSQCFQKLAQALGYTDPNEKLQIPKFLMTKKDRDCEPPVDLNNLPKPPDSYYKEIINGLLRQRKLRKTFKSRIFLIKLDGERRGWLNVKEQDRCHLKADAQANLLQFIVLEQGCEVILATLSLKYYRHETDPWETVISISKGVEIVIAVSPVIITDEYHGSIMDIKNLGITALQRSILNWPKWRENISNLFQNRPRQFALFRQSIAVICLISLLTGLIIEIAKLKRALTTSQVQLQNIETTQSQLQQELLEKRAALEKLQKERSNINSPKQQEEIAAIPRNSTLLRIELDSSYIVRGNGSPNTLKSLRIPADISTIELRFSIPNDFTYPRYQASINRLGGASIVTGKQLRANIIDRKLLFTIAVSTQMLTDGKYELTLNGITSDKEKQFLESYRFAITKLPKSAEKK